MPRDRCGSCHRRSVGPTLQRSQILRGFRVRCEEAFLVYRLVYPSRDPRGRRRRWARSLVSGPVEGDVLCTPREEQSDTRVYPCPAFFANGAPTPPRGVSPLSPGWVFLSSSCLRHTPPRGKSDTPRLGEWPHKFFRQNWVAAIRGNGEATERRAGASGRPGGSDQRCT